MITRKITNISEGDVSIEMSDGNQVSLKPKEEICNANVRGLDSIKDRVKVELDLSEIRPIKEGRKILFG